MNEDKKVCTPSPLAQMVGLQTVSEDRLKEALKLLPQVMRSSLSDTIIAAINEQSAIIDSMKRTSHARRLAYEGVMSEATTPADHVVGSQASEIERLTAERDELQKALDSAEIEAGITSNGNLWRFWSWRAKELAVKYTKLQAIKVAASAYVASVNGEPEKDCWDTEDGKEAPGALRFASDWAWQEYDIKKQKAFDDLRAALSAPEAEG